MLKWLTSNITSNITKLTASTSIIIIINIIISALQSSHATNCVPPNDWQVRNNLCGGAYKNIDFDDNLSSDINLTATHADLSFTGTSMLTDNVVVTTKDKLLNANKALITRDNGKITVLKLQHNVHYFAPKLKVTSNEMIWDVNNNTVVANKLNYRLYNFQASGTAKHMKLIKNKLDATDITYTTCAPCNKTWSLTAKQMSLDLKQDVIKLRHVTLYFKDTPVFYVPKFTKGLQPNYRKTGLLTPGIRYSKKHGMVFSVPFYFNLSHNYDLTFEAEYLSKRGVLLHNQLHHVAKHSDFKIDYNFIAKDNKFGRSRNFYHVKHNMYFNSKFLWQLDYASLSDSHIYQDFAPYGSVFNYVLQSAAMQYSNDFWFFRSTFLQYKLLQTDAINHAKEQYRKIPELELTIHPIKIHQNFSIDFYLQHINFSSFTNDLTKANRLLLAPQLMYKKHYANLKMTQKIMLNLNYLHYYNITSPNNNNNNNNNDNVTRNSLSFVSHYLKADHNFNNIAKHHVKYTNNSNNSNINKTTTKTTTQTLTNLLSIHSTLLYQPKNFTFNWANFDSQLKTLKYDELFKATEFTGPDKLSAKTFLALGIVNNLNIDNHYFGSVKLGSRIDLRQAKLAPLCLNATLGIDNINFNFDFVHNLRHTHFLAANTNLVRDDFKIDVGWYFDKSPFNLQDLHAMYAGIKIGLNQNLSLLSRVDYNLTLNQPYRIATGLEYLSCCWEFRLLADNTWQFNENRSQNISFRLQFVFKGFGAVGNLNNHKMQEIII